MRKKLFCIDQKSKFRNDFSQTVAEIEWLLLVLVIFYLMVGKHEEDVKVYLLIGLCAFTFFILLSHYFFFFTKLTIWQVAVETWIMILLITWLSWHTGRHQSLLVNLYFLPLIISGLALGTFTTILEALFIGGCYFYMLNIETNTHEVFTLKQASMLLIWQFPMLLVAYVITQTIRPRLAKGFQEGHLVRQYMPLQVHNLLLKLKINQNFESTVSQVVVLMSDLEGYTTLTDILKEPENLLGLLNDYLNETSLILQEKYRGWLESYLGDMFCYYWPFVESAQEQTHRNALHAALELAALQQNFFASVPLRYADKFDPKILAEIVATINAGIALTDGFVAMGNQGPIRGIKKFGILGDPLNLVSRIEGLTRMFNTEIIVTEKLANSATTLAIPVRRLGLICVRGRSRPEMLYALGFKEDQRFDTENIAAWENWLTAVEQNQHDTHIPCPEIYRKDRLTIENWLKCGFLTDQGVWRLQEK